MSNSRSFPLISSVVVLTVCGCASYDEPAAQYDSSVVQPGAGGDTAAVGPSAAGGSFPSGGSKAVGKGGSKASGVAGKSTGATTQAAKGGAGGGTSSTPAIIREFWISPTGDDRNPGTKDKPLFSLCDEDSDTGACYKVCSGGKCMSGGATIWVMDGTYKYGAVTQGIGSTRQATADSVIRVWAELGAKPVFDFTGQPVSDNSRGIQLQGDYWHIKGITATKAGDVGIFVMGSHNIIEQCVAHHNQDAGFIIGVNNDRAGTGIDNLILNCDSYQNYDSATRGENADGFGLKKNTGAGNVFRGCRAWDNGDDGWDFYGWGSPVTLENCWAINQAATVYGSASDGNGFKLGSNGVLAAHKLSDCYAVANGARGTSGCGFTTNGNPAFISCTGTCGSWGNKRADQGVSGISRMSGPSADEMIHAARLPNGDLPSIDSL